MPDANKHYWGRRLRIFVISLAFSLYLSWLFSSAIKVFYILTEYKIFLWLYYGVYYVSLSLFIYGIIWGGYNVKLRRTTIKLPNLPESFDGLKIIQISDLHLGTYSSPLELDKSISKILNENPDIVFFTGDLVNNRANEARPFIETLKKIQAPLGVFSILGNHDYGDYASWKTPADKEKNLLELENEHKEAGWDLLLNEHRIITRGNDSIALIGVQNWGSAHRYQKYGDLKKAVEGLPNTPIKLLLSHDPAHFNQIVSKEWQDINVTFSGHIHGGQVGLRIGKWEWSPIKFFFDRWAGLYTEGKQYLYVNRGLGMFMYSWRVGIWPEISVITLTR